MFVNCPCSGKLLLSVLWERERFVALRIEWISFSSQTRLAECIYISFRAFSNITSCVIFWFQNKPASSPARNTHSDETNLLFLRNLLCRCEMDMSPDKIEALLSTCGLEVPKIQFLVTVIKPDLFYSPSSLSKPHPYNFLPQAASNWHSQVSCLQAASLPVFHFLLPFCTRSFNIQTGFSPTMTPFNIWVQVVLEMWVRRPGENSLPVPSPNGLSCCIAHSISPLKLSIPCIYSRSITMPDIQCWDAARCLRDVSQQTSCFNNLTPICFPIPFYSLPRIHCSCQTCSPLRLFADRPTCLKLPISVDVKPWWHDVMLLALHLRPRWFERF